MNCHRGVVRTGEGEAVETNETDTGNRSREFQRYWRAARRLFFTNPPKRVVETAAAAVEQFSTAEGIGTGASIV